MVKEALIRLNPEIAEDPSRADEVIYKLRTLVLSVQPHNLVTQNEIFKKMIFEENSYPFGKDGRMVPIRFFGTMRKEDLALNEYVVTNQWIYPQAEGGKRLDIVLLINGFPIAIGELKTPVRSAITWLDAAGDISAYEKSIPAMFVTNVFNFATEGKCYRYGSINMPINMWGPWHTAIHKAEGSLADVKISVEDMLAGDKSVVENTKHDMLPLFIAAKRVEGCSEKSLRYYESTIRNMLEDINKPECQITTEDLRGYLDTYQRRGTVSKVTLDNVRRILSSFFAWLEDEDYIVKSPVRRIHMRREKQEEISLQWDGIERELHNESLWFFLTNSVKGEYQTRIDLVLDLIAGKEESTREKYYTFFRFDELRKKVSLDDIWKKIYQTFLTLKGWYEDHDLYHRIGYLITSGTSLHKIFALSKDKKKSEFNESLDELIKKSVAISGNYSELSYEKPLDYKRISTLLLLFNIESVRRSDGHAQRFPFDQFKHHKGSNVTWSLEHIHAQQSEGMKTQDVWKKWLELHIPSVESIGGEHSELIDEMQGAINADKLERTVFESIQQKVLGLLSVSGNTEYMHSIANLALLNTADNAALNNSTFDVKRNDIIQMDKKGQYIPFCTKMVFLKYYTPSAENQLHFWGQADRIAYIKAINDVLSDYIEPIVLEKEETK